MTEPTVMLGVRVTAEIDSAVRRQARESGLTIAEWLRQAVIEKIETADAA